MITFGKVSKLTQGTPVINLESDGSPNGPNP